MSDTRYRREEITLTRAQSKKIKAEEISSARDEVAYRKRQLADAEVRLKNEMMTPPPTSCVRRYSVERGEPGYDDLPPVFDPITYTGKYEWINTPAPQATPDGPDTTQKVDPVLGPNFGV